MLQHHGDSRGAQQKSCALQGGLSILEQQQEENQATSVCSNILEEGSIHSVHIAVHKVHKPATEEISGKRTRWQGCNQLLVSCPRSSQSGRCHKSPLALWRCPWTCVKCCVCLHERLPGRYGLHP